MNRFASELEKKTIILRQEGLIAGEVEEVIINPDNGAFLGFVIAGGKKSKIKKALAEKDILGINEKFVLVKSLNSLGDLDDIVRIKEVREQKILIEGNKVYTVSNHYLGKVKDYTIDLVSGKVSRLYIDPKSFAKLSRNLVIDASQIVSIKKHRITVQDAVVKPKAKAVKGVPVKNEFN